MDSEIVSGPEVCPRHFTGQGVRTPVSSLKVFDMLTALTGATGFLGSYLLRELLATGGEVVALVRGSLATAARRVRHAVEATGSPLPEDFDQRVHLLRYDLHDHALGLDRAAYTALAESIDAVWHCAGSIALTGPWDQLYRTNVDGTRHVLELARAMRPHNQGDAHQHRLRRQAPDCTVWSEKTNSMTRQGFRRPMRSRSSWPNRWYTTGLEGISTLSPFSAPACWSPTVPCLLVPHGTRWRRSRRRCPCSTRKRTSAP